MQLKSNQWAYLLVVGFASAGIGGVSCRDKSDFDPSTFVGPVKHVCEGVGDDGPCDDSNGCTADACNAAGLCEHASLQDGTYCDIPSGETHICISSKCIPGCAEDGDCGMPEQYCLAYGCASCGDGAKNGDETGVDCGGTHCEKKCLGDSCQSDDECPGKHCVDKVCCNEKCDATCYGCAVEGALGQCTLTPKAQPDDKCTGYEQCDGMGECKSPLGELCGSTADCLEGECYGTLCKLQVDDMCTESPDCSTAFCDSDAGTCELAPLGWPCEFANQCTTSKCDLVDGGNNKICQ